ncbi:LLM class F420-dependent oxidoreductase [Reticulibacter mediterranei]|uniref:LLM class F420-dependent oxidoreductase n=1 Tax=Reticulibacter mediterranei TaxID=2778369 RepID=A0A8J3IVC1_9CHLR|nr:TIGR03621 family F420-dependent LLM class oxidoreductase [Reticulibacter mediterranei]GHO99223.1 LLM class F420-dependent oxidoreductase [Reticulibacter mediterranei]
MAITRPFRFGLNPGLVHIANSREELVNKARRAEELGYSTFFAIDHFPAPLSPLSPLIALMAVADATQTLRVGTFVLSNDFRHPALLAKEAATLNLLSNGRFEMGIGAGYMRSEYEQVGIPFDAPGVRIRRLEEGVRIIKTLWTEESVTFSGVHYTITNLQGRSQPAQHPPILIGGGGKRLLSVAGRVADIISFNPQLGEAGSTDIADSTETALQEKLAWVREAAGERFPQLELNLQISVVVVTEDRISAAQAIAKALGIQADPELILSAPYALIGTVEQIIERLYTLRERYGINYFVVPLAQMDELSPIVARLAGA